MDFYKGMLIGIAIGVVAVMFIIPILQELSSVIVNVLEVITGYSQRNITKRNAEMQLIQAEVEDALQPVATSCMGFEVPSDEYIYGDECECHETNKVKIGFQ